MYNRNFFVVVSGLAVLFICVASASDASVWTWKIEKSIKEAGYELSVVGIRKALSARDWEVLPQCLLYIEQERLVELLPDVKAFFTEVDEKEMYEGIKLRFVRCLLAIDNEMKSKERDAYVNRARELLFRNQYTTTPIQGYLTLLAAHQHQEVDIYNDLLFLSCTDILKGGENPFYTRKLFELYGDRVAEADLDKMLGAWSHAPKRQEFILRRAREHGMRLEQASDLPESHESRETAPPAEQGQN